jgi:hypothetical protein
MAVTDDRCILDIHSCHTCAQVLSVYASCEMLERYRNEVTEVVHGVASQDCPDEEIIA